MEDSFWYLLNNPICYNEIIYRWFDKHSLFCMFPQCESFFRMFRLTGRAMTMASPNLSNVVRNNSSLTNNRIDGTTGVGILEEIEEVAEDLEVKRGKSSFLSLTYHPK